eukprot:TRINITY_DN11693_c0_g1_i1.p1 TRINITY_DN11693_c0_g1~~TRINITY_DN11693_c0_g1_i1.p1  ORF type:complete len:251 (+),score=57.07 TRINITY_DN11693_c0_g1_i1:41-793(+)
MKGLFLISVFVIGLASVHSLESFQLPTNFTYLSTVDPSIIQEIRYHTYHNFVGRPVNGYLAPKCILTIPAAVQLSKVQKVFLKMGISLKVYDCYRPQRAVDNFVNWSQNITDQLTKDEFYPNVNKADVFKLDYVAHKSGHTRGSTVDVTLVPLPPAKEPEYKVGEKLYPCFNPAEKRWPDNMMDFGTGYDCFDDKSHTDIDGLTPTQKRNRQLLRKTLMKFGFKGIASEWWHFTLNNEPYPNTYFDFPIQ